MMKLRIINKIIMKLKRRTAMGKIVVAMTKILTRKVIHSNSKKSSSSSLNGYG